MFPRQAESYTCHIIVQLAPADCAIIELFIACCSVELRTQDAERGLNSEEAEKLVWAAQTIFATGCESPAQQCSGSSPVPFIRALLPVVIAHDKQAQESTTLIPQSRC